MQADMAVAHLALELGARHQGGDAVDHQDVDGAGPDQRVADLQRLLAAIGLAEQQIVHVHAQLAGIDRVQRMLGIDEGAGAAAPLRLGDGMQGERRLAGAFRAIDLDDAAARQAADAEREVEPQRAGGNDLDPWSPALAPIRMIEPLPKARSIWVSAASSALFFSMSAPRSSAVSRRRCDASYPADARLTTAMLPPLRLPGRHGRRAIR